MSKDGKSTQIFASGSRGGAQENDIQWARPAVRGHFCPSHRPVLLQVAAGQRFATEASDALARTLATDPDSPAAATDDSARRPGGGQVQSAA
jgi:hypothetical protein